MSDYILEKARSIKEQIRNLADNATDDVALKSIDLFDKWKEGVDYSAGSRVVYEGMLYNVIQSHTSQQDWMPGTSPSLFSKVLIPDGNEIYEWEQPDSTNPYSNGDKVTHNGYTWISVVDDNVWEPGVYGWEKVS